MSSSFINNYFGFNRQQRNGLLVLMFLSLALFALRLIFPYFIEPADIVAEHLPAIREAETVIEKSEPPRAAGKQSRRLFAFDPNTATAEELSKLGFREKTATTLLKLRKSGFRFRDKKDLMKVYGLQASFYKELEPFIAIAGASSRVSETPAVRQAASPARQVEKVELNSADSVALLRLSGIGPVFAGRIVKYRTLLGGYVSVDQLKEVYGFNEEIFSKVQPAVTVNAALAGRLDLNSADFKTVNRHPYISYEMTKEIFNFRRKASITSSNIAEVITDADLLAKLKPYLVLH